MKTSDFPALQYCLTLKTNLIWKVRAPILKKRTRRPHCHGEFAFKSLYLYLLLFPFARTWAFSISITTPSLTVRGVWRTRCSRVNMTLSRSSQTFSPVSSASSLFAWRRRGNGHFFNYGVFWLLDNFLRRLHHDFFVLGLSQRLKGYHGLRLNLNLLLRFNHSFHLNFDFGHTRG